MKALLLLFSQVVCNSLWPCGLQYSRLPYPSLSPGVCSNSCPLSQSCHPLLLSSTPALHLAQHQGLFQGIDPLHKIANVLELQLQHQSLTIQGWFAVGLTYLISLQSKGLSRVLSNTAVQKHQYFGPQLSFWSNFSTCLLGKTIVWTTWTFVGKVMSLLFNMLSRFVIAPLPRSKCLLI